MPQPFSASSVLRAQSPRKMYATNRFLALRDDSPGPPGSPRPRANSLKRKEPEGPSFASIVTGQSAQGPPTNVYNVNLEVCSDLTLEVAKVSSLVDKAATEVNDTVKDPVILLVFSTIVEAMRGIVTIQDKFVTKAFSVSSNVPATPVPAPSVDVTGAATNMVNLGAIPKKPRNDTQISSQRPPAPVPVPIRTQQNSAPAREPDPVRKRFRDTIREAEKATCIFNLDLGKVPLMNKETLAKRATLALTTMAAAKEKKSSSTPSEEAIAALDDVLSVTKNHCFLGTGTKTYRNERDPLSGLFCTAPVKYEFKDRETRISAERVLRARCGVNCNVPYPLMVRESIKQIVNMVKRDHPDNFIRVTVDTDNMVFNIARKPPKGAPDTRWQYGYPNVPIPDCVMDTSVRRVPEGFKLDLPFVNNSPPRNRTCSGASSPVPVPMVTDSLSQEGGSQ
jgi:hypothetical protein